MDVTTENWLISLWLVVSGACVGSFLNVVVYRMPMGLSVTHPGSHCPQCKHPVRWYDNIPVVSWIWLQGKCRDCGESFSIRYAMIEALVALIFLLIGYCEGLTGGSNLPSTFRLTVPLEVFYSDFTNWILCVYHLTLICTLICLVLIEYDQQTVVRKLFGFALLVGLLAPPVWPFLHPARATAPWLAMSTPSWEAFASAVTGFAAGTVLALFALAFRGLRGSPLISAILCSGIVGSFLGWQAATAIVTTTVAFDLFSNRNYQKIPWTGPLLVTTTIWTLAWKTIVTRFPFLEDPSYWQTFVAALLLVFLCALPSLWKKRRY